MSALPLPPNPCLVAILFVVKTSSDPSLMFHYPPRPGEDNSRFQNLFKENNQGDESSSSTSGEESPDSSTEARKPHAIQTDGKKDSPPDADVFGSASPEKTDGSIVNQRWNDLFGYQSSVLAKLLTPAVIGSKKKFEVGMGDKVMLGRPVFARVDGGWKRTKKKRRSSSKSNAIPEKVEKDGEDLSEVEKRSLGVEEKDYSVSSDHEASAGSHSEAQEEKKAQNVVLESSQILSEENEDKEKAAKSRDTANIPPQISKKPLVMFHVVYVLQPPPLEYHIRVGEMYDNIVRKFSKALKWEQSRSNYVANEASVISSITKATTRLSGEKPFLGTLYRELLTQSSLAKAIASLYNSVSNLRIAHVNLTPSTSLSLQIPIADHISALPNPLSPQLPGLWLTTASSMPADDAAQTTGTQLGSHFTLLLLSDLSTILADVSATSSPITDALTHYLRVSTPTKSFHQISQTSGIPLPDIQFLASHLIYWRRARAIPPLHQRDTYIVSPNADMRKLSAAALSFANAFPSLPSLPHILSMLSSRVRPFSSLIPSKDHKATYMDILAWLMRGGWVTQLRTFAWVRVPPHIKESVEKETSLNKSHNSPPESMTNSINSITSSTTTSTTPCHPSPSQEPPSPTSSTHTTLPYPSTPSPHHHHHHLSLIPNPSLASDLPSHHLSAISQHILEQQGAETQTAWGKCIRYFDGRHAVETIAVREGWKRKRVRDLVEGWVGMGVLGRGRHW